ncbi:Twinfilin-1 [Thecaphora frezii]
MNSIPVSDELREAFESAQAHHIRAILVQHDAKANALRLVSTLPPSASDRDDFEPTLGQLFADDPNRSGYALYRLDSQAASGEWEWLCCALQPDGAKIKEKMQYALTRSSLLAALTERRFLDIIFGTTPHDFIWPTKLRNSRKHDYQNPQLKIAGVSAADAAGTGSGGARRTFGTRSGTANLLRATDNASPSPPATLRASSPPATQAKPPQPKRFNSHSLTDAFRDPGLEEKQAKRQSESESESEPQAQAESASHAADATATLEAQPAALAPAPSSPEQEAPQPTDPTGATSDNSATDGSEDNAIEAPATPAVAVGHGEALSQPTLPSAPILATSAAVQEAEENHRPEAEQLEREEERAEAHAPSESSTPRAAQPLSQPTLPASVNSAPSQSQTPTPTAAEPKLTPVPAHVPAASPSSPSAVTARPSETRIGYGTGPSSGLTRREEELLELRKLQASERLSGGGSSPEREAAGSKVSFKWADGVVEALQGLGSTASGTSEWNLVVLSIDLSSEMVELAEAPRFVPGADLMERFQDEPRMAFYRIDDAKVQGGAGEESKVVMLYYCPSGSSVKARMVYSSNVLVVMQQVKRMAGLRVVKKVSFVRSLRRSFCFAMGWGPWYGFGSWKNV